MTPSTLEVQLKEGFANGKRNFESFKAVQLTENYFKDLSQTGI
jgi:hypothetical protein